ncbi:hypothetical protein AAMO2058_000293500 [Amorphochlora amoebiformis]
MYGFPASLRGRKSIVGPLIFVFVVLAIANTGNIMADYRLAHSFGRMRAIKSDVHKRTGGNVKALAGIINSPAPPSIQSYGRVRHDIPKDFEPPLEPEKRERKMQRKQEAVER